MDFNYLKTQARLKLLRAEMANLIMMSNEINGHYLARRLDEIQEEIRKLEDEIKK